MEDTLEMEERERCPSGHLAAESAIDRARARDHFARTHTRFETFSDLMAAPEVPVFSFAGLTMRGRAEVRKLADSYDEASARRGLERRCIRKDFA